jgi:predicted dehydrogenase/threonine dehydrogenase-like Zn-dependent dehydrogenase
VSLISAGTERMLVDFARGSLLAKARQQPEKVQQALQKLKTDGPAATWDAISSKLSQPVALGYCNVGRVLEVGQGVDGFAVGERVVSNGKHADVVVVPKHLCARIPDGVDDESSAFAVLGAIALQGVRLAAPTLGEAFVVTGLGLIGLLAVQILRANGCRVLAVDSDPARVALAARFGAETVDLSKAEDPLSRAEVFSRGRGVDGVLLTLSTQSSEPVSQAAQMCRKRGRVVLVGVAGLELKRSDFYEKEISFQVSCSYGPGRYDPDYEDKGLDYPLGYVRWTEQRNFEAVLDMLAAGVLDVRPLISHRLARENAAEAYDVLAGPEKSLGILLDFGAAVAPGAAPATRIRLRAAPAGDGRVSLAMVGAGNYGGRVLAKAFSEAGAGLQTIVSESGTSAAYHGARWGFAEAASDVEAALDPSVSAVCIATRHSSHARLVLQALRAGKHVFVEKPLCLRHDELEAIRRELTERSSPQPVLTVGFNRRFAPLTRRLKKLLDGVGEPKSLVMTVNAGQVPNDSWIQDPEVGGGRLVGEACHFVDLFRYLIGAPVTGVSVTGLARPGGPPRTDVASITLSYADGSFGVINYLANGHRAVAKERLEAFCAGRTAVLNNFLSLTSHGWPGSGTIRRLRQDKGQSACAAAFLDAVRQGGAAPIPLEEILETSRISIEIAEQAG